MIYGISRSRSDDSNHDTRARPIFLVSDSRFHATLVISEHQDYFFPYPSQVFIITYAEIKLLCGFGRCCLRCIEAPQFTRQHSVCKHAVCCSRRARGRMHPLNQCVVLSKLKHFHCILAYCSLTVRPPVGAALLCSG